jgi:SAM-dependent methyltransferase
VQQRWSEQARATVGRPADGGEKRQERLEDEETGGRVELVRGNWLQNGFPSRAFDLVLAIESISHMGDLSTCLTEGMRVLRPGGRFVAAVWCASEHASSWSRRLLLEPICREGPLAALRTPSAYESALRDAGFRDVRFSDWTLAVRRTWRIVLRRMARAIVTRPEVRAYLADPENDHRVFARAAVRIAVAQHLGVLRYGRLGARRPE